MKITERIEMIDGIKESWYDFDSKTLSVYFDKCKNPSDLRFAIARFY